MLLDFLKKKWSYFVMCLFVLIVFTEWLEYLLLPFLWPDFSSGPNSVRMLIVSDPQLLGYTLSPPGLMGHICRWDADRYVWKTFEQAHRHVSPDVVVFLGDNLDEGEVATDREFEEYIKRFQSVFQRAPFHKAIIVPGDNDIGGEDQPPSPDLERRFNQYFREDVFIPYRFLEFVKVNHITHSDAYLLAPNNSDSSAFRIVLSHIPLTSFYSTFVGRVIPYLKPHIILSAHDHKSGHWVVRRGSGLSANVPPELDVDSLVFSLNASLVHEIMVPTCSYRMGTNKMGYGALHISVSGEAFYAVLWLPSRFRQLCVHLLCATGLTLYLVWKVSRAYSRFLVNKRLRLYFPLL